MMPKHLTSRRRFLQTSAAGLGAFAAPNIIRSSTAQAQENVVNVWTYAGFLPDEFVQNFQNETGITIQTRLVDDQGKQFNLLVAEQPNPTADIVTIAGHRFEQFITSELLEPIDVTRLTNWDAINPVYTESDWLTMDGNVWGVPMLLGAEVLAYNTEVVTPEEVESWAVMFDPKYQGQTAYIIQDMMSVMMLYLGYDGTMVSYMDDPEMAEQVVNEARDFMIEHKGMVRKFYEAPAEVQQMFINQDIVLAQAWSGPISKLIMDGVPVDMTIPKEGSFSFVYNFNVTKNAPNPDNAYTLLNAILESPEVGTAMTRASGFISTIQGAEEALTDLERQAASFSDEELSRLVFFDTRADSIKYPLVDPAVEEVKAA
jgi:spermidine/putrescine transport system substrate-binding protein